MYKTILTMSAGAVLLAVAASLFLVARGAAAKPAGKLETFVITAAKHHFLIGNKTAKNPLPANSQEILEGKQNFSHYCYVCHGLDGQGTGVPFADAMSPPLPSLASESAHSYSDGQLFWVIKNGLWPSGMPRANGILNDDEIWSIVTYIRHLPPAGSLPDPPAFSAQPCDKSSNQ